MPWKGPYGKDPWITTYPSGAGQCVELTVSLTPLLWNGNDKKMAMAGGDGWMNAQAMLKKMAVKLQMSLKLELVFSTTQAKNHTGVISHVFANGDVLLVEQNTPYSGHTIGEPCTWNFRLMKGASAKKAYMPSIWYPGDAGFEPNKTRKH